MIRTGRDQALTTPKSKLLSFNEEEWSKYLESWPELLQLTYFIYDDETGEVDKIYDNYVEISPETKQKMEETEKKKRYLLMLEIVLKPIQNTEAQR